MQIDNVFDIGDLVYLKHDPDQFVRQVVAIKVFLIGEIMYELKCSSYSSLHYDFEISAEKRL
jgi:hypothetical protein